eukprot:764913-Hanusia_phi.AAC.4
MMYQTQFSAILALCLCFAASVQSRESGQRYESITETSSCPVKNGVVCGTAAATCTFTTETENERRGWRVVTIVHQVGRCTCPDSTYLGGGNLPCVQPPVAVQMDQDRHDAYVTEQLLALSKCNSTLPALCPKESWVTASNVGKCMPTLKDCTDNNSSLIHLYSERQSSCNASQRYCDEIGCVPVSVQCPAISTKCSYDRPYRCPNLECNSAPGFCGNISYCPADKPVLCMDGLSCAANLSSCAQRVFWNGCGAGMVQCSQLDGMCANSVEECANLTGCPTGQKVCGVKRDGNNTVELNDNGLPMHVCNTTCSRVVPKRLHVPEQHSSDSSHDHHIEVRGEDHEYHGGMRVRKESHRRMRRDHRRSYSDSVVNFTFSNPPDSVVQYGAFRRHHRERRLRGRPLNINPSAEIEVTSGLEVHLPVVEDSIHDANSCQLAASSLAIYSARDATDENEVPEYVQSCVSQYVNGSICVCMANVTHFSTFAVAISPGAVPTAPSSALASTSYSPSGSPATAGSSSTSSGSPVTAKVSPASRVVTSGLMIVAAAVMSSLVLSF